jgi:hypothetical protein
MGVKMKKILINISLLLPLCIACLEEPASPNQNSSQTEAQYRTDGSLFLPDQPSTEEENQGYGSSYGYAPSHEQKAYPLLSHDQWINDMTDNHTDQSINQK